MAASLTAPQGARIRVTDTIATAGVLTDPTTAVKCNVLNAAGSTTYTYGVSPEMGRTSTGLFYILQLLDVGGDWMFTFYILEDDNDDPGASYKYVVHVTGNSQVGA